MPDQMIIAAGREHGGGHLQATRGDGYLFVYAPTGKTFSIHMGKIPGNEAKAWWFDPRTGKAESIGTFTNEGEREFDPPGEPGREFDAAKDISTGNDWVLVVDDKARSFPVPGERATK